ncbi:rpl27a [Ecytonucleospora hepatopenaei]|uniref:Rpl27a n=1 Tax=Ecytonucleospora hepatopenaei TaxID=646526 RepID=A0A1W0E6K7_9MICR|nr:rpl27a [Ecytonucleospora hepatopenaei]
MIFEKNMIVVMTKGRMASKKAVVLSVIDESYVIVAGINRIPYKVKEHMAEWQKKKAEKFLTFVKRVNVKHLIATRYVLETSLPNIVEGKDISNVAVKSEVNKEANKVLKEVLDSNECAFLFKEMNIKA